MSNHLPDGSHIKPIRAVDGGGQEAKLYGCPYGREEDGAADGRVKVEREGVVGLVRLLEEGLHVDRLTHL